MPVTSPDLAAQAAAMNEFAQSTDEYGGQTITVDPGDVTLYSGGSLTDANGNVFTLQPMTGDFAGLPLGDVYVNGVLTSAGGGFIVDIRLVNGTVYAEDGKGIGWFGPDRAGASDPGPGDNAGAATTDTTATTGTTATIGTTATTATTDTAATTAATDTTVVAADDTQSAGNTSADDTVVSTSDMTHHNHDHMSFIRAATTDTTASADVSASGNVSAVNSAVVADLGTSAVADITSAGGADTSVDTTVSAGVGDDDLTSHHQGLTVDSLTSQLFAHCSHQQADSGAA